MKLVAMRNIQIDQIDAHFSRHNVPEQMTSVIVRCSAPTNKHEHGISLQNKQKQILEQHRWIRVFCRVDCIALSSSRSMSPKIKIRDSAHKKINKNVPLWDLLLIHKTQPQIQAVSVIIAGTNAAENAAAPLSSSGASALVVVGKYSLSFTLS